MLIWTTSYGQFDKLKETCISKSNDVMIIEDTVNEYNTNNLCTSEEDIGTCFYLIGNTLSFQQHYYISPNYKKMYILKKLKSKKITVSKKIYLIIIAK
jgi:hypothetical protein